MTYLEMIQKAIGEHNRAMTVAQVGGMERILLPGDMWEFKFDDTILCTVAGKTMEAAAEQFVYDQFSAMISEAIGRVEVNTGV